MIDVTFPDNSTKQFKQGVTGLEIAKTISNSLAKAMLALQFNNEIININDPINSNGEIKIITWEDEEGKQTFWHSSAHLMAEAIQKTNGAGVPWWPCSSLIPLPPLLT